MSARRPPRRPLAAVLLLMVSNSSDRIRKVSHRFRLATVAGVVAVIVVVLVAPSPCSGFSGCEPAHRRLSQPPENESFPARRGDVRVDRNAEYIADQIAGGIEFHVDGDAGTRLDFYDSNRTSYTRRFAFAERPREHARQPRATRCF